MYIFEYYVLNYDFNKDRVVNFNIFNNISVNDGALKAVKKYLRAPSKYKYEKWRKDPIYGFDGFVAELDSLIKWQEWSRCEYEIAVGSCFNNAKAEKWDCYEQAKPNMVFIAHEVIRQYKEWLKNETEETT